MMNSHPSEKEIQQYAIDKSGCSPAIIVHMESCLHCLSESESYQLLFSEIQDQPEPVFDFDLSARVLSRLPVSRPRLSVENTIAGFLVVFSCFCIGIPVYLFRKSISYLLMDIPHFFIYAIIASTAGTLLIKIILLYKKYLNQLRHLNFN